MNRWLVSRQGKFQGPYTLAQLQELVRAGSLKAGDMVCAEGGIPTTANKIAGLFDARPAAPLPPSGPRPQPGPAVSPRPGAHGERMETPVAPPTSKKPDRAAPKPAADNAPAISPMPGGGWSLPKPVLFGMCGAIGGILAALLVGELLWFLSSPPIVQGTRVAAPASMPVYVGDKNRFKVNIERDGWNGPAELTLENPPAGITAPSVTVATKTAEMDVIVGPKVPVGTQAVTLQVKSAADGSIAPGRTNVNLEIKARPASLSMTVSPKVVLDQGGKGKFTVRVLRDNFDGPVAVDFSGQPSGVRLPSRIMPPEQNEIDIDASADDDSVPGNQPVSVHAKGADADAKVAPAKAQFELQLRPRPIPKVDIVFVIDVSASMDFAIFGVRDGIGQFVKGLRGKSLDYRVAVVLFNNHLDKKTYKDESGQPKWAWPLGLPIAHFTSDPDAVATALRPLKTRGGGPNEGSYDGLNEACKLSFRPDAKRVLLLITDEPPLDPEVPVLDFPGFKKPPYPADFHIKSRQAMIDRLKEAKIDQLHTFVRTRDHKHFQPLQAGATQSQGDDFFKLDKFTKNPNSGAEFVQLLPAVSQRISSQTVASLPDAPAAEKPPELKPALGNVLPAADQVAGLKALHSNQRYAEADKYRLLLAFGIWTAAIAAGISLLISLGQRLYLRKGWFSLTDSVKAAAGGALAGLIAGAFGQEFAQLTTGTESEILGQALGMMSRMVGWGLLGGLIGLCMALFVPNLLWRRGLLSGVIGGIFAAAAFLVIDFVLRGAVGEDVAAALGRVAGAGVLGFAIGLMVAIAEWASRQRWLEISFGREVRTVSLGASAVAIGGDQNRSSIVVPGAAPIALRYRVDNDAVFCEDTQTGITSEIAPGDKRTLGGVTIALCSSATAKKTGYVLTLADGRSIALTVGMPLAAADLPGLEPQGTDGIVALVSARPNDPTQLMVRNRSKQTWKTIESNGTRGQIGPGLSARLEAGLRIDFGAVQAEITRAAGQ